LTVFVVPSQKSQSIFSISELVNTENLTDVGNLESIVSTFMKKLNHKSESHKGVLSKASFHKEMII
jgi:hypothetical protein